MRFYSIDSFYASTKNDCCEHLYFGAKVVSLTIPSAAVAVEYVASSSTSCPVTDSHTRFSIRCFRKCEEGTSPRDVDCVCVATGQQRI